MEDEVANEGIFSNCQIAVIRCKSLPTARAQLLEKTLDEHGAEIVILNADGSVKLDEVSHIVSETSDFPQYELAYERMIPVVNSAWISTSLVKGRLNKVRPFTPDPRLFFSGVTLTCADIPEGDKDAIVGAVLAMGGQESSTVIRTTTHIVALTLEHAKCQYALGKKLKCKIVLPHWFDDCLKLGKRIDETPYLLPNPEVLLKDENDEIIMPEPSSVEGATSARPDFVPAPTESPGPSRKQMNVFMKKSVMLSDDLNLGCRLRAVIEGLVTEGGGIVTKDVREANIYVCHWRAGPDYIIASQTRKDVGNLSWLYHLITNNEWTSPLRRLLHYPLPKDGIPGFKRTRITVSNYGGDARVYLENLVIAAGGEFTKSMRQDNTHLITAQKNSEKCNAAREWNIEMVNHLWIEESYAKCTMQSLTNPRYAHFPRRTNLGEIIGQTQFDQHLLEELYYPGDSGDETQDEDSDAEVVMKDVSSNPQELEDHVLHAGAKDWESSDVEVEQAEVLRDTPQLPVNTSRNRPSAVTPSANRLLDRGKENYIPSSTSSRGAKDRALSKLHDLADDVALYEKEKKRASGGGLWGGRRAADLIDKSKRHKRTSSSVSVDEEAQSDNEQRLAKKAKTMLPPVEVRLLITGYKRWVGEPEKEGRDQKVLRQLGILLTQDPAACTHLAAPKAVRTKKFLSALAFGPEVVSTTFIDECLENSSLVPINKFILKDRDYEKRYGLKLKDSLERARRKKRLLKDVIVYCTEAIENGPETFEAIVQANGGTFAIFGGKRAPTIKPPGPESDEEHDPVYLLTSLKPKDVELWSKFEEMARTGGMEPRIVDSDWLLDTAITQEIQWDERYLAKAN